MPRSHGVLHARNISRSYADVVVLEDFSLTVAPGRRIGLVGPNGIGKSTLLEILAGVAEADSGRVEREPAGLRVAFMAQTTLRPGLSPGQAARAALEALADADADVLLLDEPTNSLDEAGLARLEALVAHHRGGVVAASHDRVFLELMNEIVEFEADTRRVTRYHGGWSEYEHERALLRARQAGAYGSFRAELERFEEHAARLREWQQRGYGQGRKKKKTRDVAKALEQRRGRIETVEKPWSPWQLQLSFERGERGGEDVALLQDAVVERGGFRLGPLELSLCRGERLAIRGANGSGKSTLLAALLGQVPLATGVRQVGPATRFGTLEQVAGPLAGPGRLIDAFTDCAGVGVQDARSLLAKFGLGARHVERPAASLSPGERTRAGIALLAALEANALVLDEPTNNLDLEAIEQLELALAGFAGTIVLVSHDRRFLEAFGATRTLTLGPGGVLRRV